MRDGDFIEADDRSRPIVSPRAVGTIRILRPRVVHHLGVAHADIGQVAAVGVSVFPHIPAGRALEPVILEEEREVETDLHAEVAVSPDCTVDSEARADAPVGVLVASTDRLIDR